jgi:hypothetical protein
MTYPVVKMWLDTANLCPEILEALERLRWTYPGLVITSTNEQVEARLINSAHYQDRAVDFALETRHGVQVDERKIAEVAGPDYDVVGPLAQPGKNHIHFEYDPEEVE